MKKPSFYAPNCVSCEAIRYDDPYGSGHRYCTGFQKKKRKRLPKNGLKKSIPEWCPKLISPPACRIYGFAYKDNMLQRYFFYGEEIEAGATTVYPLEYRYKLRSEYELGMTAKEFYEASLNYQLMSFISNVDLNRGEVVEIDDGHKPYFFYYAGNFRFLLAPMFDAKRVNV